MGRGGKGVWNGSFGIRSLPEPGLLAALYLVLLSALTVPHVVVVAPMDVWGASDPQTLNCGNKRRPRAPAG